MAMKEKKIRIFSALEVANICGVVNQTAINWIKNGFLKAFVTPGGQYRIYSEDLFDFLKSRGMRIPEALAKNRPSSAAKRKVLIIDDDEAFNNMLQKSFSINLPNHEIRQAFDGFEAGSIITEWYPEIIILDIDLPGIDGHKLCQRIKSDPKLGNPLVLVVTGLDDPQEKDLILKEGADSFWAKPFDHKELAKSILDVDQKGN